MAADDLYELTQFSLMGNNKIVNRFFLRDVTGASSTPESDIMDGHALGVVPKWQLATSEDITVTELSCRRVYPAHGPTFIRTDAAPGLIALDTEVPQSVAVLALYTPNHTRRGRGRTHVSGVPKANIKDGLLTGAQGILLVAIITQMIAGFGDFRYVIADPDLGSFADINSGVCRTHTYTLRSRKMAGN